MNKDQHMVMQACEEILANQGRMTGIDAALLENLEFTIGVYLRESNQSVVRQLGNDFSAVFGRAF